MRHIITGMVKLPDVPDDLTIDIRNQMIYLTSNGKTLEINNDGRIGVFAKGPVTWERLKLMYLLPALSVLREEAKSNAPVTQRTE